jgi:Zn-dependent protease
MAHGYAAYKLGDPTARAFGRLSLNPLRHLDLLGTLCMVFFGFGWAKPVPVNTRFFKKPRRDMAITALAGPLSNILMSFGAIFIYRIVVVLVNANYALFDTNFKSNLIMLVLQFFASFAMMNLYLGVFNLIPVPPLDGSRILFVVLPDKYYFGIMRYEQYIRIALFVLLYVGLLDGPLTSICALVMNGFNALISLIPGL